MKDNKLIAEFMGLELTTDGISDLYYTKDKRLKQIENYHASWDWLMPVVEKISDIKSWSINATLEWLSDSQDRDGLYTKEDVYESVVEFIKQYNNNSFKTSSELAQNC